MGLGSEQAKFCKHCGVEHPLTSEHWYRLDGSGSPRCKVFTLGTRKLGYDPAKASERNRAYRAKHRDELNEQHRQWREANAERHRENAKKWYWANRDRARATAAEWRKRNPGHQNQEYQTAYARERRRNNPCYRLASYLRARLMAALAGKVRSGSAVRDLGCSIQELKQHLESQFTPEMSWENHGSYWEVDHILPLGNYDLTDRGTLRRLAHHSNLQPLPKHINRSKSNKED